MALAATLALGTFWDILPVVSVALTLDEATTSDRSGGGEISTATRGTRLWRGRVTLAVRSAAEAARVDARMALVREPGRAFFATPWPLHYPPDDPTGSILAAATPLLSSVAANRREIDISGLPAGFRIGLGSFVGFSYGASPTRYALHKVVWAVTASGAGLAEDVEVVPPLRDGFVVGQGITLIKPYMRCKIVPGSYTGPDFTGTYGALPSFDFIQTLGV